MVTINLVSPRAPHLPVRRVVQTFKTHKLRTVEDIRRHFRIKPLGSEGLYRRAYEIIGSGLIVKLPVYQSCSEHSMQHIKNEMLAHRALSKERQLRKRLMRVYYYDAKVGLQLVKRYRPRPIGWDAQNFWKSVQAITSEISKLGIRVSDVHDDNVMLDSDNEPVLTDLGCFHFE